MSVIESSRERGLGVLALITAAAFVVGIFLEFAPLRLATKPWPILCMIAWLWPIASRESRWIAAGLGLSALGDVLLEASSDAFLPGLVAFLIAHLCYIAAFLGHTRRLAILPMLLAGLFGIGVFLWLQPALGGLASPVLAYIGVICIMWARAFAAWSDASERGGRRSAGWALLGATGFVVSDVLVAYTRFVEPTLTAKVTLIVLYWLGQWGIAASARPVSRI